MNRNKGSNALNQEVREMATASINGRRYNPEVSKHIFTAMGSKDQCESLFQKQCGEYFLYRDDSTGIAHKPLAPSEARAWIRENADADQFTAIFVDGQNISRDITE